MSRRRATAIRIAAGLPARVGLVLALVGAPSAAQDGDASALAPAGPAGRHGPAAVVLDPAAESRAGLELGTAVAARGGGVLEAYGQVLDPVPLAESVFARMAARAALDGAQKEHERVVALHRNDANASTRELEAAELALQRARFDLGVAQARLASTWGADLAGGADLDELVHGLTARRVALARLDLPAGDDAVGAPASVEVAVASGDGAAHPARLVGPAPTTAPSVQGRGFFVLIEDGPPPGTALVGRLAFPERSVAGVRVARSAVVWHDQQAFVYVALGGGRFERRAVELHGESGGESDWLVTGALAPGDATVVSGASLLLSAEQTGAQPAR